MIQIILNILNNSTNAFLRFFDLLSWHYGKMITIGKWLNLFVKYFGPIHSSEYLQILSSKRIQNYLTLSQERETTFLSLSQLVEKVSSSISLSFSLQRRMFFRRIFRQNDQLDANQYRRLSRNLFPEWRGSDQTLRASSDWFQNDNRETRSLTKTIASSRYNISVCFVECALSC